MEITQLEHQTERQMKKKVTYKIYEIIQSMLTYVIIGVSE